MSDFIYLAVPIGIILVIIFTPLYLNDWYKKKQVAKLSDDEKTVYKKEAEASKVKEIRVVKLFCNLMAIAFISGFFGAKNFFVMDVSYANHSVWFLLLAFALVICGLKYERFLKWKSTKKWQ